MNLLGKRAEAFLIYRHKKNPDVGGVFAFVKLKDAKDFKNRADFGNDFECEFRMISPKARSKSLRRIKKQKENAYPEEWDEVPRGEDISFT